MTISDYKDKLIKAIEEYMEQPINPRTIEYIGSMIRVLSDVSSMCYTDDMSDWCDNMVNADGTVCMHFSDTDAYNPGFDPMEFRIAMNLMYSDYCTVAERYGVSIPEFYSDMATAFLRDEDAVSDKLVSYYHSIVAHK